MVLLMGHHWVSNLDILMVLCLPLMKASDLDLLMLKCLVSYFELIMDTHLGLIERTELGSSDGWFDGSKEVNI